MEREGERTRTGPAWAARSLPPDMQSHTSAKAIHNRETPIPARRQHPAHPCCPLLVEYLGQ